VLSVLVDLVLGHGPLSIDGGVKLQRAMPRRNNSVIPLYPVKRRKPLKRTGQLKRTGMKRTAMKRRPKQTGWVKGVFRATPAEWEELRRRKGGRCRVCGAPASDLHHLLGGVWRSDEVDNLIPLCGSGTTGCHGIYTSRMAAVCGDGTRRTWREVADRIRRSLTLPEATYMLDRVGEEGLQRRYPLAR